MSIWLTEAKTVKNDQYSPRQRKRKTSSMWWRLDTHKGHKNIYHIPGISEKPEEKAIRCVPFGSLEHVQVILIQSINASRKYTERWGPVLFTKYNTYCHERVLFLGSKQAFIIQPANRTQSHSRYHSTSILWRWYPTAVVKNLLGK